MKEVWHLFLHTLEHSAILLPFLFVAYILIELLEYYSASKLKHSKLLSNRWSTLFGASFGLVPQCGFSVVATDLFAQKKIKIGTLLAVYIATSDEAIPLLLASPNKAFSLIPLILIKFVVALMVGYIVDFIFKKTNQKHLSLNTISETNKNINPLLDNEHDNSEHAVDGSKHEYEHKSEHKHNHNHENDNKHENENENLNTNSNFEVHTGCCGHHINDKNIKHAKIKQFIVHPLIHTLKIFAFIFVITFIFNGLIEWLGEENISSFLIKSKGFAPLVSAFIGLIPNCASSVVITNLYSIGGIGFGALMSGLIVNAGIAFVVLFKQNKNIKQNFAILGAMLSIGVMIGYIIQLIGF